MTFTTLLVMAAGIWLPFSRWQVARPGAAAAVVLCMDGVFLLAYSFLTHS